VWRFIPIGEKRSAFREMVVPRAFLAPFSGSHEDSVSPVLVDRDAPLLIALKGDTLRLNLPRKRVMTSLNDATKGIRLLVAVGVLAACDIPTDNPKLEQKWTFPLSELEVGVAELLPDGVELTTDSSAFLVTIDGIEFHDSLGGLCAQCEGLDGLTVPKPYFDGSFSETFPFPEDVESAVIDEGVVEVVAENGFGFDPLRPPGGETGSVTLELRDGGPMGPVLDQVVIDGDNTGFGPGTSLTRELEYSGPVSSSLAVTMTVVSPVGGPEPGNWVPIELSDQVRVEVNPSPVEVSSAEIHVDNQVFLLPDTDLDVEDVQQSLVDRIQTGSLHVSVVNPWSVGATLTLEIDGPSIAEPLVYVTRLPASPSATVEVEFSQEDLQTFLGQADVVIGGQGTVEQGTGTVTLLPTQIMAMETTLDLTLVIG
jgi:hypothetical protein